MKYKLFYVRTYLIQLLVLSAILIFLEPKLVPMNPCADQWPMATHPGSSTMPVSSSVMFLEPKQVLMNFCADQWLLVTHPGSSTMLVFSSVVFWGLMNEQMKYHSAHLPASHLDCLQIFQYFIEFTAAIKQIIQKLYMVYIGCQCHACVIYSAVN